MSAAKHPQSYPPGLWIPQFRLPPIVPALSSLQITRVRFAGCGGHQDQAGLGCGAAAGAAPCGWSDRGSQRRAAAL